MTYRDDRDALRARAEAAEAAQKQAVARAEDAERALRAQGNTAGVSLVRALFWVQGAMWILLVLISVPGYIALAYDETPFGDAVHPFLQGLAMAFMVDSFFAPIGLGSLIAAVGLGRGRHWGWLAGVIAASFSLACGCLPIGIYALVVLLRSDVRTAFRPPAPSVEPR